MTKEQNKTLQSLTRSYLSQLRSKAKKYGLGIWIDEIIEANRRGECESTEKECELLARACNDDRVNRTDVPKILGVSYRTCFDNDIFDKIKTFKHVGIYSKISALLFKAKNK